MPPRRANGIAGPASAMTAYLREQGITGRAGVNYNPTQTPAPAPASPNAEAGPPSTNAVAGPSSRRGEDLIDLDEEDDDDDDQVQKRGNATKRKKQIIEIDDSDDLDGDDDLKAGKPDADTPPQKKKFAAPAKKVEPSKTAGGRPPNGKIVQCDECGGKVTVTMYSAPSPKNLSGVLCRPCGVAAGLGDYKGPAAAAKKAAADARKKGGAVQKRKIVHYEEKARILTLKDLCIELIARNVEDVETLGDIGSANMEKVNDIICKHRKMSSLTAQLFYDITLTKLIMKDCTSIDPTGFTVLSNLCPNLTSLTLNLCGQLNDVALVSFGTNLTSLARLELLGPFLVRKQAWLDFFTTVGTRLEGFLIRQSPRIDEECVETLVRECGENLTELRLSECGKMEGSWLSVLARLGKLEKLDLSYSLVPLPSGCPELEELIVAVGFKLLSLNLAGQSNITSADLYKLLPSNLPILKHLDLTLLPLLTEGQTEKIVEVSEPAVEGADADGEDQPMPLAEAEVKATSVIQEGMVDVFSEWAEKGSVGLESVKMGKAHQLTGPTLHALVALAGETLKELEIMGWKDVEEEEVKTLGERCKRLRRLDLGWCRHVTDFTLKQIFEDAEHLKEVVVWGCNSLTRNHPRKKGVKIIGVESHQF